MAKPEIPIFEYRGMTVGGWSNPLQVETFEPGGLEFRTQDSQNAAGDGGRFGYDYLGGQTWAFGLFTNVYEHTEALDLEGEFGRRWLDPAIRTRAGAVAPLRYFMNERWRRVYGRPRRWIGSDGGSHMAAQGLARMSADFLTADHLHYDDDEQEIEVGTMPATTGGFIFPAIFPLRTAYRTSSERTGQFRVQGDAPTWPKVTVHGPISDPEVSVGAWTVRFVGSLAYDRSVTIDTAPWALTVLRDDGAPLPGMLHPATRLSGLSVKPGYHELKLEGVDTTGTARATIAWRDAHYSI